MPNLHEILRSLVAADDAAGTPDTFVLYWSGGRGRELIGHPGWPDGAYVPTDVEVDEMAGHGWVRITDDGAGSKQRKFAVTDAGRREIRILDTPSPTAGAGIDLNWPVVAPILTDLCDRYTAAGAPERGIATTPVVADAPDPKTAKAAIRELARSPFLDVVLEGNGDVPYFVRPSTAALQRERGWPTGPADEIVNGLADALGAEIEATPDPARKKLLRSVRDGLTGAAWQVAIHYFERHTGL